MASYKNGSITLENVYGKKTYETTIVDCSSSTELQELIITGNGVYEAPKGTGYSPVKVNVPQTAQSGTVKALLDATHTANDLFSEYKGSSVDGLISYQDTTNVFKMNRMFFNCLDLRTIPALDTSNCIDMGYMFRYCANLTTIPALDTPKVTNMISMFEGCSKLTSIPALDASKVTNTSSMFYNCSSVTSIGLYGFTRSIDISATALGHDALVAFLNQAGTAYNSSQKITMGSTKLALLSDEEKAIATNKGWTLA